MSCLSGVGETPREIRWGGGQITLKRVWQTLGKQGQKCNSWVRRGEACPSLEMPGELWASFATKTFNNLNSGRPRAQDKSCMYFWCTRMMSRLTLPPNRSSAGRVRPCPPKESTRTCSSPFWRLRDCCVLPQGVACDVGSIHTDVDSNVQYVRYSRKSLKKSLSENSSSERQIEELAAVWKEGARRRRALWSLVCGCFGRANSAHG